MLNYYYLFSEKDARAVNVNMLMNYVRIVDQVQNDENE